MQLRQLVLWSGAFALASGVVKMAYMGLVAVLAALLPPGNFAAFGMLYAAQTAMGTYAGVGVQETVIGRLSKCKSDSDRDILFREAQRLFGLTAGLAAVIILAVLHALDFPQLGKLSTLLAIFLGGVNAAAVLQSALNRLHGQYSVALCFATAVPVAGTIAGLGAFYIEKTVDAVFAGGAIGSGAVFAYLVARGRAYWPRERRKERIWQQLTGLLPFIGIATFGWAGGYGMAIAIGALFEPVEVAHYTFLITVASVAQLVATALNLVWAPRFYQLILSGEQHTAEIHSRRLYGGLSIVIGIVAAVSVGSLPWVTGAVGGNLTYYGSMRMELALLFIGYILIAPWWHAQNYFLVRNQGQRLMKVVVLTGSAGIGMWIVCMMILGPVGIYIGFILQIAAKSIGAWVAGRRTWKLRPSWGAISIGMALVMLGLLGPIPIPVGR